MEFYNVHIENHNDIYTLRKLPEDDLGKLIDAYDHGRDKVFINGISRDLSGLKEIKVFSFRDSWDIFDTWQNSEEVKSDFIWSSVTGKAAIRPYYLAKKGDDLTKQFFNNDFGWKKTDKGGDDILKLRDHYINVERIDQLKRAKINNLDLSKLIRICEEINICYSLNCFYAVGNLLRSLIDHAPPIFGFKTFGEVTNNYAGAKSFKKLCSIWINLYGRFPILFFTLQYEIAKCCRTKIKSSLKLELTYCCLR